MRASLIGGMVGVLLLAVGFGGGYALGWHNHHPPKRALSSLEKLQEEYGLGPTLEDLANGAKP